MLHYLFVLFQDIEQASKVMEELQGSVLPSSDRGGMHIEYFYLNYLSIFINSFNIWWLIDWSHVIF